MAGQPYLVGDNPDGSINRGKLAELAFGGPGSARTSRIEELNRIVHREVVRRQDEWMEQMGRNATLEQLGFLQSGAICCTTVTPSSANRSERS